MSDMQFRAAIDAVRHWAGVFALALILLLLPMPATAQNAMQNSLAGAEAPQLPAEINHVVDQAKTVMMLNPGKARDLALQGEVLVTRLQDGQQKKLALATLRWLQGESLLRTNDIDQAQPLIDEALRSIRDIPDPLELRADLLLSRGALQSERSDPAGALGSYQAAFKIFQQLKDRRSQAIALQNIASLYREARDLGNAEKYYHQSTEVFGGDPALAMATHNNRGNVLRLMGRFQQAGAEYQAALAIVRKMDSPLIEARILSNLARNQIESGDLVAANHTIDEGLALSRNGSAKAWRPQLLAIAAQISELRGNLPRAVSLIRQAFAGVDTDTTTSSFLDAHEIAHEIFAKAGDSAEALKHLEAAKRLNDEATKLATSTNASLMSARFDYQNQELRIAQLKADELRRNVEYERSRSRFQRIIFIGLALVTIVGVTLLSIGLITIRRSRNEVRAANADLEQTNQALEKALAAKTEFLATTSHEIRTPLNGILGMTQVMLRDPTLSEQALDRLRVVNGAGETMRALVDDILDIAKMETGNLSIEMLPTDLPAILRDVSRMWEDQARERGLAFDFDIGNLPGRVMLDPGRLRQIVFNLLSNALKFTSEGGVGLRATAVGDRLRIAVSDSGIGIAPDKQAEIFESFKQADTSTTRQFGGTGLGLAICRNLAVAMGGDVTVESIVGEGATFVIDLPLQVADAQPDVDVADASARGLMIVDSNPIARGMMKAILSPRAPGLSFSSDPAEALAVLEAGSCDSALIDDSAFGGDADAAAEAISALDQAVSGSRKRIFLLWKEPDEKLRSLTSSLRSIELIEKPIAGPVLAERLFGNGGPTTLVSEAA